MKNTMLFSYVSDAILLFFFFFNDTATTEIYTLSLHDALPILKDLRRGGTIVVDTGAFSERNLAKAGYPANPIERSEEHTSELQSQSNLVCRLLLEKKKNYYNSHKRVTLTYTMT